MWEMTCRMSSFRSWRKLARQPTVFPQIDGPGTPECLVTISYSDSNEVMTPSDTGRFHLLF